MYSTVENFIAAFREEEHDTVQPYFWASTTLLRYLNEAMYKFSKETMSFRDSSSDFCTVEFTSGAGEISYDNRIFTIIRAKIGGNDLEVRSDYPDDLTGTPLCLEVNTASKWMRLRPTPVASDTLNLTVIRAPVELLTLSSSIPDVPLEHQHVLMSWVKSRAFLVGDSEAFNAEKSDKYAAEFYAETKKVYEEQLSRHKASSNTTRFKW